MFQNYIEEKELVSKCSLQKSSRKITMVTNFFLKKEIIRIIKIFLFHSSFKIYTMINMLMHSPKKF
jgi:hypothetical protein